MNRTASSAMKKAAPMVHITGLLVRFGSPALRWGLSFEYVVMSASPDDGEQPDRSPNVPKAPRDATLPVRSALTGQELTLENSGAHHSAPPEHFRTELFHHVQGQLKPMID